MKSFSEESAFDLTFPLIRIFLTVFETNSVKETADRLGVSQPSVSQHLERLRTIYKDELFSRRAGKMLPTVKAQQLEASLRTILRIADQTFNTTDINSEGIAWNLYLGGYSIHTIGPRIVDHFSSNAQSKIFIHRFESGLTFEDDTQLSQGDALITTTLSPEVDDRFLLIDRLEDPWVTVHNRQYRDFFKHNEADLPATLIIPNGLNWRNTQRFHVVAECPIESLPMTIASSGVSGLLPRSLALATKIYYDFLIEEPPELLPPCFINLYAFNNDRAVETLLEVIIATMRNYRA